MIRISKLESVIAAVASADERAVRGRLQYFAVANFPPGLRVGRARRADYGLDEVFALSLVFAMARAGTAPSTAAAVVSDFWPEIARGLTTAGARRSRSKPNSIPLQFLTFSADHLPVAGAGRTVGPAGTEAYGMDVGSLRELERSALRSTGASVLLDLDCLYAAMHDQLLSAPSPLSIQTVEAALLEIYVEQVAKDPPTSWSVEPAATFVEIGTPDRGLRLRERDYFFARVEELARGGLHPDYVCRRRLSVFAAYVAEPAPREAWKQRVAFIEGVSLIEALAVFTDRAFGVRLGVPDRSFDRAAGMLQDAGLAYSQERFAERLLETTDRFSLLRPALLSDE